MRLSRQAEALASLESLLTDLNLPQVSTSAVIEGSAGNFTTFFSPHDATFAPITNGERRSDSDRTASEQPPNSLLAEFHTVAIPFFPTRPHRKPANLDSSRFDCDSLLFAARDTYWLFPPATSLLPPTGMT